MVITIICMVSVQKVGTTNSNQATGETEVKATIIVILLWKLVNSEEKNLQQHQVFALMLLSGR